MSYDAGGKSKQTGGIPAPQATVCSVGGERQLPSDTVDLRLILPVQISGLELF